MSTKTATLGCKQRTSAVRHDKEFKLCELCVVFSHCVSYVLSPIYTAENFWHGSDEKSTRTKKIGSARIDLVV